MTKIFKCVVCALLGIIIGITATFGAMTAAVYYAYGNVTVGGMTGDKYKDELGDLNKFSVEDLLGLIQKGKNNPSNYTFRDLEERYGFDLVGFINKLGGGNEPVIPTDGSNAKYVEELKDVSVFTLLSGDGFQKFIDDLPFGAVLSFIPSSTLFTEAERVKLRRYTVGDMLKKDPVTGGAGIVEILRNVKVGGVIPALYEYDETENRYKVKDGYYKGLDLIGNAELDSFINVVTGKTDWATEFAEGGLSELGATSVGEAIKLLGVNDEKITSRIDASLSSMSVRDLLRKNYETGKYDFVIENLVGSISIGGMLGYTYDGGWYKDAEKTQKVEGLLAVISSLDFRRAYNILTSESDAWEKARGLALCFGDMSVGDFLETMGYAKDDATGKWLKGEKELKTEFFSRMADMSVGELFGGNKEMTVNDFRKRLVRAITDRCGGLTFGEAFGGMMNVELSDDGGRYLWSGGSNAGKEVNRAFGEFLMFSVNEFAKTFGGDTIDKQKAENTIIRLLDGVKLGYVVAATENDDGTWTDAGGSGVSKYKKFYEVTLDKLVEPFFNGEKNVINIFIDALGEDTTIGEVAAPFFNCSVNADGTVNYDGSDLSAMRFAADKVFSVLLKEFKDKAKVSDVISTAVGTITIGDVYGYKRNDDGTWVDIDGNAKTFDGSFGDKVLERFFVKTLKELKSNIDFDEMLGDMHVGEMMGYKHCDGTDEGCDVASHTGGTHKVGWYDKNGNAVSAIEGKISEKTVHELTTGGFNAATTLKGVTFGEATGYFRCNGAGDCNVAAHATSGVHAEGWYGKDGNPVTDVITKRVNDLDLGDVLGGTTDITSTFDDVKFGELMGYTQSDDQTIWKDGETTVTGVAACLADFTFADVKDKENGGFGSKITEKIKTTVRISDVLTVGENSPLSLIGGDTYIGDIDKKMEQIPDKTMGEFFDCGFVKDDDGSKQSGFDKTFGKIQKLVLATSADPTDTTFSESIKTKAAEAAEGTTLDAHKFWRSLTMNEMLDCIAAISDSLPD